MTIDNISVPEARRLYHGLATVTHANEVRPFTRSDELRALMLDSLPWSPLDFIKGISTAGDRLVHVEPILRDIGEADDLRFTCPIAPDTDIAVCAERLPWDSRFFGYGVARLHGVFPLKRAGYAADADYAPAIAALVDLARPRGIRYLFGVIDSRDLPTIRALTAAGFALIETRVCFHQPLRGHHFPRRFPCRTATAADVEGLTELCRSVENPYDRFSADPAIAREDAIRLMVTWIRASILDGFADATFVPEGAKPRAVCTVRYHKDRWAAWGAPIAQLILGIAAPGIGSRLVGLVFEINRHLKGMGVDHVFFTTQIANHSAMRMAEHIGFRFGRAEYVFRRLL
jgi:dTDP-4-amino-4,6-dideoxy-D-galactose acyltransferase